MIIPWTSELIIFHGKEHFYSISHAFSFSFPPSPENHRGPTGRSRPQGLNEKFALRALKEEQQAQEAFLWAKEEDAR